MVAWKFKILNILVSLVYLAVSNVNSSLENTWYSTSSVETSKDIHEFRPLPTYDRPKRAAPSTENPYAKANLSDNSTIKKNSTQSAEADKDASKPFLPTFVPVKPNVGVNGTGIRKDVDPSKKQSSVILSEPISPDEGTTTTVEPPNEDFSQDIGTLLTKHNITQPITDMFDYYNSTVIYDNTLFKSYWDAIIARKPQESKILSNAHRRATTIKLNFDFPFYGQPMKNVTVATGGFIYLGEYVHSWLAATQYIAPLMANFDFTLHNESLVKIDDNGKSLLVIWENVTLQEDGKEGQFTFAAVLFGNGDIHFAYHSIPLPIENITDSNHPVKVGISDAYIIDKLHFYIRKKTIYEYHRVDFRNYSIQSGTIVKLQALPTCLEYLNCEDCINHETSFNCTWCDQVKRCSNGNDRMKQEWNYKNCDKHQITEMAKCSKPVNETIINSGNDPSMAYVTKSFDSMPINGVIIQNGSAPHPSEPTKTSVMVSNAARADDSKSGDTHVKGAVTAICSILVIVAMGAWVFYAYRNPHTRSGQLLIKYRPSNWGWRRGEARYTAATIHM